MTQLEKDIQEIRVSLAEIKKVLGIGLSSPSNVVDIRRRAARDAEDLKRRSKAQKHNLDEGALHGTTES